LDYPLKALYPFSLHCNPGSHNQNFLAAPNLSALSALMLEQHLLLPNLSQLAPILESKLKLQPLNIKK
jgi:hypothetical protein